MADRRPQLPPGTRLRLETGSIYTITGEALGFGGGSIIYPAHRLILRDGQPVSDGFDYVIKECFPAPARFRFDRDDTGCVVPEIQSPDALEYLQLARQMQLAEGDLTRNIYRTASRMLPIRESSSTVALTLPGQQEHTVPNTVTVMESLSEKGRSLGAWIRERSRFTPGETFRVLQQVLLALQEVHQAGYLHLDIQDGNMFLRGALTRETTGELVTLLDFGSARPMENGRTLPIRDRVIFTSQGFSAPEMLLRNDGSLTLGPEADLYSVGCLALYLLTGQKADPRNLLAGKGPWLKPNHIRRMKCPRHLTESIQAFLSRALEKEPEDRFHSCREMLEAATDLAEALQPYRTDLRNVRYDAFVCYKHGSVDSAAALTLQRQLEQFRAPGKRRPFRRVFVDEGELSSCADFGLQIREALKNSGWLIVVCSPDTPLSPWVQQEIDTFLEYHDRSRILAVLTGGDEKTSFPPALRADAAGNGEILAADARGGTLREVTGKLRGDALLKLAAPMLGTTFDSLKQRQKVYLLQRVAAVTALFLALAVAFAAYALNRAALISRQAQRIEEEYRNALVNESRFLVEQAEKRLDAKDPLGALELALAALPSAEQDRPVIPQAEFLLGKALGIYTSPMCAENVLTPVGILESGDPNFLVNDSGSLIFTWENYNDGRIRIWDAETLAPAGVLFADTTRSGTPLHADDSVLIIRYYDEILCADHRTGDRLWSLPLENIYHAEISEDRQYVYVLCSGTSPYTGMPEEERTPPSLTILSAGNGRILKTAVITPEPGQSLYRTFCVSGDLKWAAVTTAADDPEDILVPEHSIYLLDLEKGTCTHLLSDKTSVSEMLFLEGRLAVLREKGIILTTRKNKVSYNVISRREYRYELYDAATLRPLWSLEGSDHPRSGGMSQIRSLTVAGVPSLLFIDGPGCTLIRYPDGRVLRSYTVQDSILNLQLTERGFDTVNADGSTSVVNWGLDRVWNYQTLDQPITALYRSGSCLYLQSAPFFSSDASIRKYQLGKFDSGYRVLWETEETGWRYLDNCMTEEGFRVLLCREDVVRITDLHSGLSRDFATGQDSPFSEYDYMGLSSRGDALYWSGSYRDDPAHWIGSRPYYRLDLTTGEVTQLTQPPQPEDCRYYSDVLGMAEGSLFFSSSVYDTEEDAIRWRVFSWNPETGALDTLVNRKMPEDISYQYGSFLLGDDPGTVYFALRDAEDIPRALVQVDTATGEQKEVPINVPLEEAETLSPWMGSCYQWSPTGLIAFGYCSNIYILSQAGQPLLTISPDSEPVALQFSDDGSRLYLICNDSSLWEYRLPDGECLSRILLEEQTDLYFYPRDARYTWPDDTTLGIFGTHVGFLVDLSGETMHMKAVIDQCFGYDPGENRFVTLDDPYSVTSIGSFPRYRLEDLTEMARQILISP